MEELSVVALFAGRFLLRGMAVSDLLGIGTSGLMAYQRAMATTGNNIANVNSEGYSRQRVEFNERAPQLIGNEYIGRGTEVSAIRRLYDDFLGAQVRTDASGASGLETYYGLASQVNNMLADPQAGLTPAMGRFFAAAQEVANDPSSLPARQVMLSEGESLARRFGDLDERLRSLDSSLNNQMRAVVGEINGLAESIAAINGDIAKSPGQAPGELLDQRDRLLQQLSERVSVRIYAQDDGSLNVMVGNGQPLVAGSQARPLAVVQDPYDTSRVEIGFDTGGGPVIISDLLRSGTLGGMLDFRDRLLDPSRNALGQLAVGVASTFNEQQQMGTDLQGEIGRAHV